jgi:hypothetical protein
MFPIITLTLKGLTPAKLALMRKAEALKSAEQPLKVMVKDFYETELGWFKSKGEGRWKPLSVAYAQWKHQAHPGKPIMRLSDAMWREFTGQPGHARVTRSSAKIYIRGVDYWKLHHYGSGDSRRKGVGNVPARPLLSPRVMQRRKKVWFSLLTDWFTKRQLNRNLRLKL